MIAPEYSALLQFAAPEAIVLVAALALLTADLLFLRSASLRMRFTVGAVIACAGCIGATIRILMAPKQPDMLNGALVVGAQTHPLQIALLVLTILLTLMSFEVTLST